MSVVRTALIAATAIGAICASYASYCGILIWSGNFHAVEEDQIYRSAQLSKAELAREIDVHHVRSALNLRGPNPEEGRYHDELPVTHEHGASHFDVGISAKRPVSPEKIARIPTVLREAPKPILVHCRSGADRTGFMSALYQYAILGRSAEAAEKQLSLRYGHFPYLMSKSGAMDESAHAYFLRHPAAGVGTTSAD